MFRLLYQRGLLCLLLCAFLTACTSIIVNESESILLWHSWNETDRPSLEQALARFEDIYVKQHIISVYVPADELFDRYSDASNQGLGPDIFFAPNDWILPLAEAGLIRDITDVLPTMEIYLSGSIVNATFKERVYGIPFTVSPVALYFNRTLVENPATTLDDLLQQASSGINVAMSTQFDVAIWGTQAFGGRLFDDQGRLVLDEGGFANWLNWLKAAQETNGMFMARDNTTLENLFLQSRVAYYVAGPEFLSIARETLGQENIGVSVLPSGPNGDAGPLLRSNALLFNESSSQNAVELSIQLALFLTNAEQSIAFVREASIVPANRQVRIDSRTYPAISAFVTQARTAVPMPNIPQMQIILTQGNTTFVRVLEGVLDVNIATLELTSTINDAYGFEPIDITETVCSQQGKVSIWHNWSESEASWLSDVAATYVDFCPDVEISFVVFTETEQSMLLSLQSPVLAIEDEPDLILATSDNLFDLAENGWIQAFPNELSPRFLPIAQQAVSFENSIYGLPLAIRTPILYYDAEQVADPISLVDELITEAVNGRGVAIPINFATAYWGISVFGNDLFNNGLFEPETSGLLPWLEWLNIAEQNPAIVLNDNQAELQEMFIRGDVAYYIGWSTELPVLRSRMGDNRFRLTSLPNSNLGNAHPFVIVDTFFLSHKLPEQNLEVAIHFAEFVTNNANQESLANQLSWIPTTASSNVNNIPFLPTLITQIGSAQALPNSAQTRNMRLYGDSLYLNVLTENINPGSALSRFIEQVLR